MNNFTKLAASALLMFSTAISASAVSHLKVIGEATPGGWEIVDGILMPPDPENENVFSCVAYLEADKEFKFTCGRNWDNPENEYRNSTDDPYYIAYLNQGGNDNKFKVRESANYRIVCDLNTMRISVTKADYQDNPIRFNALYMVGSATPGDWSILKGTAMKWGGEADPFKFTWTGDLKEGEFKYDTNIYNDGWDGPWLFAGVDGAGNIDYTKIVADGTGDRKWHISEAGKYDINVDLLNGTISIAKSSSSGIDESMVEESEEAPVYYNLLGVTVKNPTNGIYLKKVGNKVYKVVF